MKFIYVVVGCVFILFSCAEKTQKNEVPPPKPKVVEKYPEVLKNIFKAHGGLKLWENNGALEIAVQIKNLNLNFKRNTDNPKMLITSNNSSMGRDVNGLWFFNEKKETQPALFSHWDNLFFVASMPYSIAYKGAFYTQRLDEILWRKKYGVLHVGFGRGSGKTADDAFIIYFDKETHQIEWVAFSEVVYGKYKSKNWKFVKYTQWKENDSLLMPHQFEIYASQNNKPTALIETVVVSNFKMIKQAYNDSIFKAPVGSVF